MKTLAHSLDLRIFNRLIAVALFTLGVSAAGPLSAQVPEGYREVQVNGVTHFGLDPAWKTGREFEKALDGDAASFYDFAYRDRESFVGFDGGEAVIPEEIVFQPRSKYAKRMVGGKFQGSNESSVSGYETIYAVTATPVYGANIVPVSTSKSYRYFRYLAPAGSYGNIAEFSVSGRTVEATVDTGSGTEIPDAVTAAPEGFRTSELYGITVFGLDPAWAPGREFEKALDGDPNTFYDFADGSRETFVGADAGREVVPATLYYTPRKGKAERMVGGLFQGSNESPHSGYETFYEVTGIPADSGVQVPLEDVPAYRYFRYLAPAGSFGNIAEFGIYVASDSSTDGGTDTSDGITAEPEGFRTSELYGITVFGLDPAWASGREFEKALDGDPNTFYDFADGSRETFVGADAGREVVPATLYYTPRKGKAERMVGGLFQGSNEGPYSGYETFYEVTGIPAVSGVQVPLEGVPAYRYFRYLAPAGSHGNIAEFGIYIAPETTTDDPGTTDGSSIPETGTSGSETTDTPSPSETDSTTETGTYREAVVDGLTVFGLDPAWASGREFEKALDGDPATFYDYASGDSTFVGFDAGEAGVPRTIRYAPRSGYGERMVFGRFEGSNDSPLRGFTTLHLVTSTPSESEQVVTLQGETAYRYYRYVAPSGGYGNIAEFSVEMDMPASEGPAPDTGSTVDDGTLGSSTPESGTTVTSPTVGAFTLGSTMKTSAGIYSPDGTLVRTLWSNVEKAAGTHAIDWDGNNDLGNIVADTTGYYAEVLVHNISYTFEGTVGHSGPESDNRFVMFNFPSDLALSDSGKGLIAHGYNESRRSLEGIDSEFNRSRVMVSHHIRAFEHVAVDNNRFYAANTGTTKSPDPFIVAIDSNDTSRRGGIGFLNGTTIGAGTSQVWNNAILFPMNELSTLIDGKNHSMDRPSGLAVEVDGGLLFASIYHRDKVAVFDKITGDFVRNISVSDPRGITVDSLDNHIWVISGKTVKKFQRSGGASVTTIGGLANPLALSVNRMTNNLYIVDGGWSQQIKVYSSDGNLIKTYGLIGGYESNGPLVTYDKFSFATDLKADGERSFIHVTRKGKIYVGDTGNNRVLVFDLNFKLVREEHWMPHNYYVSVDQNDPTKVFTNGLEYKIDYSKPLVLNQGWKLWANWVGEIKKLQVKGNSNMIIKGAMTLTSREGIRRTYLVIDQDGTAWSNGHVPAETRLYEIVDQSVLRKTSVSRQPPDNTEMRQTALYKDGLRYVNRRSDSTEVVLEKFYGFDDSGDPLFEVPRVIATGPNSGNSPSTSWGTSKTGLRWPSTSSGKVIFFDGKAKPFGYKGMHLGAVGEGSSTWTWQSSPSGIWEAEPKIFDANRQMLNPETWGRVITRDGSFHAYNHLGTRNLAYAGNRVHALGRNIVYGHQGEFFSPAGNEIGQTNQFLHWYDNGLFIGQFGTANYPGRSSRSTYFPGMAGNSFSNELVKVGNEMFFYTNDESGNRGIPRWKIENEGSIRIHRVDLAN